MAEYFETSSGGMKAKMASISDDFPAADELCTMTAKGASSLRETQAR